MSLDPNKLADDLYAIEIENGEFSEEALTLIKDKCLKKAYAIHSFITLATVTVPVTTEVVGTSPGGAVVGRGTAVSQGLIS